MSDIKIKPDDIKLKKMTLYKFINQNKLSASSAKLTPHPSSTADSEPHLSPLAASFQRRLFTNSPTVTTFTAQIPEFNPLICPLAC